MAFLWGAWNIVFIQNFSNISISEFRMFSHEGLKLLQLCVGEMVENVMYRSLVQVRKWNWWIIFFDDGTFLIEENDFDVCNITPMG